MDRVSIISLVVGSVLPLLTATVTKGSWPEWVKQLLLAVLSAGTGVGTALEHSGSALPTIIANGLTTFATAAAVAAATWKPTGAYAKLESFFIRDTPAATATVAAIASDLKGSTTASVPTSSTVFSGSDTPSATPPNKV